MYTSGKEKREHSRFSFNSRLYNPFTRANFEPKRKTECFIAYLSSIVPRPIQGSCYGAESILAHNALVQGPITEILLLTIQRPFFLDPVTKNAIVS